MRAHQLPAVLLALVLAAPAWSQAPPVQRSWSHDSAGLNWRPESVRLGNHGTAVFSPVTLNNARDMLLSRHDGDPAAPVWQVLTAPAQVSSAAAAEDADCYVVLSRTPTAVLNEDEWRLRRYDSAGLVWTWLAPFQGAGRSFVGVDRAGTRIVTVIGNPLVGTNELSVFDPAAGLPASQHLLPSGTVWSGALSSDGSRLALALGDTLHVIDVVSGASLFQKADVFQLDGVGLGLSADGAILATGESGSGAARVYSWDGAAYQLAFSSTWPGASRARCIAVSEDGGTVAVGSYGSLPTASVRLEILDVATQSLVAWEQLADSGPSAGSLPVAVDVSADGAVVALAVTGDPSGLVDALRFYLRERGVPIATFSVPGDPASLDLSADGRWAAVGLDSWPMAAPSVQLYRIGLPDLAMYGTPSLGTKPRVELRSASQGPAWLILAQAPLASPLPYPVAGDLLVDPTGATQLPFPSGSNRVQLMLPADVGLVGSAVWIQGLGSRPWRLSEVAFPVVLLP